MFDFLLGFPVKSVVILYIATFARKVCIKKIWSVAELHEYEFVVVINIVVNNWVLLENASIPYNVHKCLSGLPPILIKPLFRIRSTHQFSAYLFNNDYNRRQSYRKFYSRRAPPPISSSIGSFLNWKTSSQPLICRSIMNPRWKTIKTPPSRGWQV